MSLTYTEYVIMMFKIFHQDMGNFKKLFEILSSDKDKGIVYSYHNCHTNFLDMHVGGVGLLRLHYHMDEKNCEFIFKKDNNNLDPDIKKIIYTKMDLDMVCESILPFLISKGTDKRKIPLILNIYPSFAKFALEFVYDPEY